MIRMSRPSAQCYVLEKTANRTKHPKAGAKSVARKYRKIKESKLKFEELRPLHKMWKKYMEVIVQGSECKDERLLKADYHGCLLCVSKALNHSQTGIHGYVIRETRNAFLLLSPKNKILTIPKQGSAFQFVLKGRIFTIFGDNFRATSAGRIQKKFKNATVPDLLV